MRPQTTSLRTKIMVLVGGSLLTLILGLLLGTFFAMDEREEEVVDEILAEQMNYSLKLYHMVGHLEPPNVPRMSFYVSGSADPRLRPPEPFAGLKPGKHEVFIGDVEFHVAVRDEGGQRFLLTYDVSQHERRMSELYGMLWLGMGVLAVLSMLSLYWLSGRVLDNLSRLSGRVREGQEGVLDEPGMEREVQVLAQALDDYRARQAVLLQRERDFSGHLSHELRTPLSVIRSHAELLSVQLEGRQAQQRTQDIMGQVDRMRQLIERMLRLARAPNEARRETVLLLPLLQTIWGDLETQSGSPMRLECALPEDASLEADPLLLELILRNALENARRHSEGLVVWVSLEAGGLCIADDGPGEPGPIAGNDDDNGSGSGNGRGLGLAILRQACQALGWQYRLYHVAEGTRLEISWP